MICALFSCSPNGVSILAMGLQAAHLTASGDGYNLKNSHSIGRAAFPIRCLVMITVSFSFIDQLEMDIPKTSHFSRLKQETSICFQPTALKMRGA